MARIVKPWAMLAGCLAAASPALAQLADPTRPPEFTGGAGSVPAGAVPEGGVPEGPVLQSVFRPRKGKPEAFISGVRVKLGEMVGEEKLVYVGETWVTLAGAGGRHRLELVPGVQMTPVVPVGGKGRARERGREQQ